MGLKEFCFGADGMFVIPAEALSFEGIHPQVAGAIVETRTVPQAAVGALSAGCDTLLVCGESVDRHAAVIEGVIHAVERGELAETCVEAALARQRRVKARFLGGQRSRRPLTGEALRERLGTSAHQAVADEIVRA